MDYQLSNKHALILNKEPLAGADLHTIFTLLIQNKFHVSIPYYPRIMYSLLLSSALSFFRIKETNFVKKIDNKSIIKKPPLFLLGHWRSGTTYLHNVLSKDDQFGFFSTFDAYLPGVFLTGEKRLKPIVAGSIPKKRPMDDVAMDADLPQEEEYALGGTSIYSYYHGWIFPKNMEYYNNFVLLDNVPQYIIDNFKRHYINLLKKATYKNNGKRLLLKNPSNTARIKILLDLFPDAKFVHIQRNPYHQYLSMIRFMKLVIPLYCVQNPPSFDIIEKKMMNLYAKMYKKYFKERTLIPKRNLVEIRYEDFINDPYSETKKIYNCLELNNFSDVNMLIKDYILSQLEIKTASYNITDDVRNKVYSHWAFVFDEFEYDS